MRILLIDGAVSGEARYDKIKAVGSFMPPYGLLMIGAVLEAAGHEVRLVETAFRSLGPEDLYPEVESYQPDLVGLSVFTVGSKFSLEAAQAIKKRCSVPIVAGGPHLFVDFDQYSQNRCFDYCVKGEGEVTIIELVTALEQGDPLDGIGGLSFWRGDELVVNEPRKVIKDLDTLPMPAFHLLERREAYHPSPVSYRKKPHLGLVTSRGCPFACVFCEFIWGRKWRAMTAEAVVDMVERMIATYGAEEIWFCDDTFFLSKARVQEICRLMLERNLNLTWSAMGNLHVLDEETARLMKQAGCWQVQVGIESGNEEIIKKVGKPQDKADIREKMDLLSRVGIKVRGFFILGHMEETRESMNETIEFAKSLPLYSAEFYIMQLPLGSEIREVAHKYGKADYDYGLLTAYSSDRLSFIPEGMTAEELFAAQRRGHREFFLRPRVVWQYLSDIRGVEDIKRYLLMLKAFWDTH